MKTTAAFLLVSSVLLRRGIADTLESLGARFWNGDCLDDYLRVTKSLGRPPELLIADAVNGRALVDSIDKKLRPRRVVIVGMGDAPIEPGHWVPDSTCSWLPIDAPAEQVERTFAKVLRCRIDLRDGRLPTCTQCILAASLTPPKVPLSAREQEIFVMVSHGEGPQKIADAFGISIKTVETHLARIKRKLGAQSSADLLIAAVAWRLGWLRLCTIAQHPESTPFLTPTGPVTKWHQRPIGDG